MPAREVSFEDVRGDLRRGALHLPVDGEPIAFAVFGHATAGAAGSGGDVLADTLANEGWGVLRVSTVAAAEAEESSRAEGIPASSEALNGAVRSGAEILTAAAAWLGRDHVPARLLLGHGVAGAAALLVAPGLDDLSAVATIGAPSRTGGARRGDDEAGSAAGGGMIDGLAEALDALHAPLLVLHSPVDNVVGVEDARELFTGTKHPKSFIALDAADHELGREEDARRAGQLIASWAQRYLRDDARVAWQRDVRDNRVVARTDDGLRTDAMANGFGLVFDEPRAVGGTEAGPTPYDYLASALGACTSMTLRMYADRKKWPLASVTVEVRHAKVHAADCLECGERPARLDRFVRTITLEGLLDAEQRARLLEIANRCPVHRTLASDVQIETTLRE